MAKKTWIAATTAGALVAGAMLTGAVPAAAHAQRVDTSHSAIPRYDDLDVLELLVFGQGAAAADEPELVQQLGIEPSTGVSVETMQEVLTNLRSIDPAFHENVTLNAQAGDPYRAEAALTHLNADIVSFAEQYEAEEPGIFAGARAARGARGSVWAFSNYLVSTQVAVTAAAVASVVAVALAIALAVYQRGPQADGLVSQNHALDLSGL